MAHRLSLSLLIVAALAASACTSSEGGTGAGGSGGSGSGAAAPDRDPDKFGGCPTFGDGVCDQPIVGNGTCPDHADWMDCYECPWPSDGYCDDPTGTGWCPAGTDPGDCGSSATAASEAACKRFEGCQLQSYGDCMKEAAQLSEELAWCVAASSCTALAMNMTDCSGGPTSSSTGSGPTTCGEITCSDTPGGNAKCEAAGCGKCALIHCTLF